MKNLLKTGEFASLCQITKRVLFYYDEIGLLKPAYTDEKGYRYYSYQQYDKLSAIKMFQSLGMSLNEIQKFIQMENYKEKKEILNQQLKIIHQKMEEYQNIQENLLFLRTRLNCLENYGIHKLFEETIENEYYLIQEKSAEETILGYLSNGYQYGIIIHSDELKKEKPDFQYIFQKSKKEQSNYTKKSGKYYAMCFILTNETIFSCIPEFLNLIDLEKTQGPLYHESYCSEIMGNETQIVIKLSIQKR